MSMAKKKVKRKPLFEFDLMKELQDREKKNTLASEIKKKIQELKRQLREGTKKQDFAPLGTLLHGYQALLKTLDSL